MSPRGLSALLDRVRLGVVHFAANRAALRAVFRVECARKQVRADAAEVIGSTRARHELTALVGAIDLLY